MTRFHFGIGAVALAILVTFAWPAAGCYARSVAIVFLLYLLWCYHKEETSTREALRRHGSPGWTGDWL